MRLFGLSGTGILRGMGLAIGGFAAVNQLAEWLHPGFDANLWWVDFPVLPAFIADALLILFSAAILSWSLAPVMRPWRRAATLLVLTFVLAIATGNAFAYYGLLWRGSIHTTLPVAFSLLIAGQLVATLISIWHAGGAAPPAQRPRQWPGLVVGCVLWAVAFPLAQAFLFGKTDYRRPADAILIFGARVYANGQPSLAVADRVRTGCALYHEGMAPLLIVSGGPGEGSVHETQAMAELAVKLGVPADAVLRDPTGVNTQASVRALDAIAQDHHLRRVLAVSHYWHLPRIKLAAGRRETRVLTVPAEETRPLGHLPYQLAREVAAFWSYYASLLVTKG